MHLPFLAGDLRGVVVTHAGGEGGENAESGEDAECGTSFHGNNQACEFAGPTQMKGIPDARAGVGQKSLTEGE